jgi:DNA sulfur modification protein DndC
VNTATRKPPKTEEALRLHREAVDKVKLQYTDDSDDRAWVLAYSGGKDSSLLAHVVFEALSEIRPSRRKRRVYVVCSDTRVETPDIAEHVHTSLLAMDRAARASDLPLSCHVVTPPTADTYWVRVLGHGYPPPSRLFRWCTDRMKINPNTSFVKNHISRDGRVLILIGARDDESQARKASLDRWNIEGEFQKHRRLKGAIVWAPIRTLTTDQVWRALVFQEPPWGGTHVKLRDLYKDAHAGECFLVTAEGTDPCGNSRFGCWTCTVVDKDKSLEGLIESGRDYASLGAFRDKLLLIRDSGHVYRMDRRKNGQEGIGPLKQHVREELLRELLELQSATGLELIGDDEIRAIRLIWTANELDGNRDTLDVPTQIAGTLA